MPNDAQKFPATPAYLRIARRWCYAFALLVALTALTGAAFYQPSAVHTPPEFPDIHWDHGMIYPGQNNGNPWGPVGETAVVHGTSFPANLALILVVVNGDSNKNAALCQPPKPGTSVQVGTATTDASGAFNASFSWPTGAGPAGHQRANSICSYTHTNNTYILASSHDDSPFTVLTDNKPTFSISAASLPAGKSVTVTGRNWVPAQPLNITIAGCADCDPGNSNVASATTTSQGQNTGTFNVQIPIPANANPGNYVVNVVAQSGTLDAYRIAGLGVKHLTVTAPVATPTPTAAPSPSPTAAQTATATPTTNTTNTGSTNGGNSAMIIALVVIVIVLLAIGGLLFFLFARRKKQEAETSASSSNISTTATLADPLIANQLNQYNKQNNSQTPFPQGQAMNAQGQFGNVPNAINPGYQQSWPGNPQSQAGIQQPWQGNPQSGAGFNQPWPNNPQSQPGFAQPWQGGPQQENFASGGLGASPNQPCMRCGRPLAPNTFVCGVCGTNNASASSPNDPTIAF